MLLGFAGIIAINVTPESLSFHIGDLLIIAASFCTVFSDIISKKVFAKVAPITATGCAQLFGGLVLLSVGSAMGGSMTVTSPASIGTLVYICLASIISYCVWFTVVKSNDLSKLFIIKFAEPMFASLLGAFILGENIWKWQYLVAFLLIAGGIYIANSSKNK